MRLEDITKRAIDEVSAQIEQEEQEKEQSEALENESVTEFSVGDSVIFSISSASNSAKSQAVNKNFKMTPSLKEKIESQEAGDISEQKALENSAEFEPEASKKIDSVSDERLFLSNLKDRIEVLFDGLNKAPQQNLQDRLDLTLKFLEFALANVENRLENLTK